MDTFFSTLSQFYSIIWRFFDLEVLNLGFSYGMVIVGFILGYAAFRFVRSFISAGSVSPFSAAQSFMYKGPRNPKISKERMHDRK